MLCPSALSLIATSDVGAKPKALGPRMIGKPKTLDPDIFSDLSSVDLTWLSDSRRSDMTKILDASYFFVFSEPKSVIVLYIEIEKIWNTLFRQLILFFILEAKKYFYCYDYCEKPRKPLVNSSNFCWLYM